MLSDVFKRINVLIWWFLLPALFCLFPSTSLAAKPEQCGNGIDDSLSTGGVAAGTKGSCPANFHDAYIGLGCDADCDSPDKDGDGYSTTGALDKAGFTTTDCDDTNPGIYPGVYVDVSGTGYKLCQTNGTYGSTVLNATTPLCESPLGPSGCFYIDFASGSDAALGTFAAPFKTLAKISGGFGGTGLPASPHTIAADEYFYVINAGTLNTGQFTSASGTSSSTLFETAANGTSGHEWHLKWYPGATGVFSNTNGHGLVVTGSYGVIDGALGSSARTSVNNAITIYIHPTGASAHHVEVKNSYISSMGGHGDNNDACINATGTHDVSIHHNFLRDCKRQTGSVQNIWAISHLDETGGANGANHKDYLNTIWWQTFDATNNGGGIRTKHGVTAAETGANGHIVAYNSILNAGFAAMTWSSAGMRAYGNRFALDDSVYGIYIQTVNGVRHEDNRFQYNTMISGLGGVVWSFPYYSPPESLLFDHNIIIATPTAYLAGNNDGVISIDGYGSNSEKLAFDAGYLTSNFNCFYSPNATAVFSYFRDASGIGHGPSGSAGASYSFSGGTSWQTTIGQDASSILGDPGTSSPKYKGTSSCSTFGWNNALANFSGGSTSTTTTTTSVATTSSTTTTAASTTTLPPGSGGALPAVM